MSVSYFFVIYTNPSGSNSKFKKLEAGPWLGPSSVMEKRKVTVPQTAHM